MKRLVWILLFVLLLNGCAAKNLEAVEDDSAEEVEIVALYAPETAIEKQTAGAVRVYPLGCSGYDTLRVVESHLLVKNAEKMMVLTGDTKKQREVRTLLPLENYLYGYKEGLAKLPTHQRWKVYGELAKVSFEDLQSLPKHHLKRLTLAQLYDWLHFAGYEKDAQAVAFVEALASQRRKSNDYYK